MKKTDYITIQAPMVTDLKLSGNNLIIFALIHGFCKDGNHKFTGSLEYISEWTNLSKPTIIATLKLLVKSGLINKEENIVNHVKFCSYTTNYEEYIVNSQGSKDSKPLLKKYEEGSKDSLRGGKDSKPNNIDDIYINKDNKEDTKKETSQDIVTFWNDKTSDFPKVRRVSDDINNSIKKLLVRKYTYEDIKKAILLCNSLDDFYKGRKKGSNWKATLQWLLANTNKNFDKILNGALHTSDTQQKIYDNIMSNNISDMSSNYNPKMDGFNLRWIESEKCYMTPFDFSMLDDGYSDNDRPSNAVVMYNGLKYQWNVESKEWRKL